MSLTTNFRWKYQPGCWYKFQVKKILLSFVIIAFVNGSAGCGSRTPSPQTAHNKIRKHFVKYGHKYKDSDFGKHPIDRVEIVEVREIQKNMAEADAYAYLADGTGYKARITFLKKPFGWKVIAWENLGSM